MLRLLFTPRWLGAVAVGIVLATTFFFLGRWQWHRYEAKHERAQRIEAHYDMDPVPLESVLGRAPVPLASEWTRVSAQGRYLPDEQLLVRNRALDGTYGYEVLVPLRTASGTVVVDRGWVENSRQGAEVLPDVPPAPSGAVTVTGWVRTSEPSRGRDLPAGQVASINVEDVESATGSEVLGGYVSLQTEQVRGSSDAPARPTPLERPSTSEGPHRAYAIQWWSLMPVPFVLIWFGIRREQRDGRPEADVTPKRVRIWDEEDE